MTGLRRWTRSARTTIPKSPIPHSDSTLATDPQMRSEDGRPQRCPASTRRAGQNAITASSVRLRRLTPPVACRPRTFPSSACARSEGGVVYGMPLQIQSQSRLYVAPWEKQPGGREGFWVSGGGVLGGGGRGGGGGDGEDRQGDDERRVLHLGVCGPNRHTARLAMPWAPSGRHHRTLGLDRRHDTRHQALSQCSYWPSAIRWGRHGTVDLDHYRAGAVIRRRI